MAAALPRKTAAPSRPESRSPSSAPFSASTAKAREIARSADRSTVTQKRPGRDAGQDAAVGVEGEREQQQHDDAERRDLLQRDARAHLDAEVLAGDEPGFAPELRLHPALSRAGHVGQHRVPRRRRRRYDPARDDAHLARCEGPGPVELVRGEDHGAALGGRGGDDGVEQLAAGRRRGPACGSSRSSSFGSRASATASASRRC